MWFAAYVATIALANLLTDWLGLVPAGFGLLVPAGTYAAGAALLVRDYLHRAAGIRWVLAGIGVGGVLSWFLASPALAVASVVAFAAAELADLAVFTPMRRHGFVVAAVASNLVSAPLDTFAFLALAGFPITVHTVAGQLIVKILWCTAVPLTLYYLGRRRYALAR